MDKLTFEKYVEKYKELAEKCNVEMPNEPQLSQMFLSHIVINEHETKVAKKLAKKEKRRFDKK